MPLVSMFRGDTNLGAVNGYVALLQRFLVMNGVLTPPKPGIDPVNGEFDAATEAAVISFQTRSSIPVTGEVDGGTWAAIAGVSSPLTVDAPINLPLALPQLMTGDMDSVVTVLQRLLFEYSVQPGQQFIPKGIISKANINGSFDSTTENAVKKFQENRGLPNDGIVGNDTWMKLLFPRIPVLPRH